MRLLALAPRPLAEEGVVRLAAKTEGSRRGLHPSPAGAWAAALGDEEALIAKLAQHAADVVTADARAVALEL